MRLITPLVRSLALLPVAFISLQACGQTSIAVCCEVVSIDTAQGVVTATDAATGRTFSFSVASSELLAALQPGMSFDSRGAPGSQRFSLMNVQNVRPEWFEECCELVANSTGLAVDVAQAANRFEVCCEIVSVGQGIVTARDASSGRTFQFETDQAVLAQLDPGVTFDTRGIPGEAIFSVIGIENLEPDSFEDCCNIVGQPAQRQSTDTEPRHGGIVGEPTSLTPQNAVVASQRLADGVTLEVTELRAVSANTLHLAFVIVNQTTEIVDPMTFGILGWVGSGPTKQANGIQLQNLGSGQTMRPSNSSQGYLDVEPNSRREYWAQYQGMATDVTALTLLIPDAPPLYDVPLQ